MAHIAIQETEHGSPVTWLERRVGRVVAVLSVVALVCALLVAAVWGLTLQLEGLTKDLPRYRATLVEKLSQVRHAGEGNVVNELTKAVEDVQHDLQKPDPTTRRRPAPPGRPISTSFRNRGGTRSSIST